MRRVLSAVLAAVVLLSARAAAQDTTALITGDREASAELASIVKSASDRGLPIEPIFAKVKYGVLVAHAPSARIVAAARAVASRLEIARDALAPDPAPADIVAGADALGAGVTAGGLQVIRAASRKQSVATPLGVLSELVSSGVPAKRATEIVTGLIKRGATPQQIVSLGNGVNADIASGERAVSALDVRLRGLNAVLAPIGTSQSAADITASSPLPKGPRKP